MYSKPAAEGDGSTGADGKPGPPKSAALMKFEGAFMKKLSKENKHFSKGANDIIIASMAENAKAKKKYMQQRRQSVINKDDSIDEMGVKSQKSLNKEFSKTNRKVKEALERFLDNNIFIMFMSCLTIYALFFDDIRILAVPIEGDNVFFTFSFIVMIVFGFEVVISSYAKDDYMGSFFFWLDVVSTISMIPDVGWLWSPILDALLG